jgi:hypothetical protein
VFLLFLNGFVGGDIIGNLLLGMVSAVIALWTRAKFNTNLPGLIATLFLGVALVPYFGYLLWYAALGAREGVPSDQASAFLVKYVMDNFISSLPSTIAAGLGGWIIDSFSPNDL